MASLPGGQEVPPAQQPEEEETMMKANLATGVPVTSTRISRGWCQLKDDAGRSTDKQCFLGHTSLETLIAFYAGTDETLSNAQRQALLAEGMSRQPNNLEKKRR